MPINEYFHGHGSEVMEHMKEKYGEKKGEQVFYATANKRGEKAADEDFGARMHRALDYVLDCLEARAQHSLNFHDTGEDDGY